MELRGIGELTSGGREWSIVESIAESIIVELSPVPSIGRERVVTKAMGRMLQCRTKRDIP